MSSYSALIHHPGALVSKKWQQQKVPNYGISFCRKLCRNIVQSSNSLFRVWFPKEPFLVYNGHQLLLQETEMHNLTRITFNPEVMGGKPCIRGMRVTVGAIVGLIRAGKTIDEVLQEYTYLEQGDVLQALSYAAWRAEEREVPTSGLDK
jgi:uncharacterized protein (DUF433 family)